MAYDDDGSLRFRDFEEIAILIERYLSAPENLTVTRIIALILAIHEIIAGRGQERVELREIARGLRQRGLATVPFDTMVRMMEVVGKIPSTDDVLAHITLRELQRILSRE